LGERAKLIERIGTHALEKLGAADVDGFDGALGVAFAQLFHCVVEPEADEVVSFLGIAGVLFVNEFDDLRKIQFRHNMRHVSNTAFQSAQSRPEETVAGEMGGECAGIVSGAVARSLRILRVINTLRREAGGPVESVLRSSEALRGMGHQVEVATADAPGALPPVGADFPLHPLGGFGRATLGRWLRENRLRFDAVIVQGLWHAEHTVRCALRGSGVPYFVFPHGMLDSTFARLYPLKHIKKQLYWWWREGRALREAAAVCFTSEEERQRARGTFCPYSVNERVVAYGTAKPPSGPEWRDTMCDAFLEKFPELRERDFLLFLGRLHHKKGLHELIEGFAKFREAQGEDGPTVREEEAGTMRQQAQHQINGSAPQTLVIAGPCSDPKLLRALMRHADQLGLAQLNLRGDESGEALPPKNGDLDSASLVWLPMLGDDLKWGALLASEAFVLSSHQENFGIAVAEALACRRPVLISDKVNIWREIAEASAGFVAPDTVEGVRDLLTRWASLDPAMREAMGVAAAECFEQNFEISRAAESLVQTIRECLAESESVSS